MPATEREVAAILGRTRALEISGLVLSRSGSLKRKTIARGEAGSLYVPSRLESSKGASVLVEVVGRADAELLSKHFGGMTLFFRPCTGLIRRHRDAAIRRMVDEGWRTSVVAWMFEINPRTVLNVCNARSTPPDKV